MTNEELQSFKKHIANPAMQRLMEQVQLKDGTCFLNKIELCYLDGRSYGTDTVFKAHGLQYLDGAVQPFTHEALDTSFPEFLTALKDAQLASDGELSLIDDLRELDIKTTIRSANACIPLFPDLTQLCDLDHGFSSLEYEVMCRLYQASAPAVPDLPSQPAGSSDKSNLSSVIETAQQKATECAAATSVYLVPHGNGLWHAAITDAPPSSDSACLTAERSYPVELYYARTDLNGSSCIELNTCKNARELVSVLDWLGLCCFTPLQLWDFDHNASLSQNLISVLDTSAERRHSLAQQAIHAFTEDPPACPDQPQQSRPAPERD